MRSALLVLLCSCGTLDTVEGRFESSGIVYICDAENPNGTTVEYCWNGELGELEAAVDLDCHATDLFERTSILGCWYHCNSGAGCNAHNGCYCP